ncbi:hypothetical protein A45J_2711 [hot springs metagenome]|uniref:Uncharacterized protein n=1 Tax=hot springs metagenome TaxID=433727 RepID=A0A5J4KZX2_9ZZZZ
MTEAIKYKNHAAVTGYPKVIALEEPPGKKPYLNIELSIPLIGGSLTAYGKMRGDETEIRSLQDFHKANPAMPIDLKGMIAQFEGAQNRLITNFTFFRWSPYVGPASGLKAAFVLRGELVKKDSSNGTITISQPRQAQEEVSLTVHLENHKEIENLETGTFIEVKGMLKPKTLEDRYGESTSPIRPYAEEIFIVEEKVPI